MYFLPKIGSESNSSQGQLPSKLWDPGGLSQVETPSGLQVPMERNREYDLNASAHSGSHHSPHHLWATTATTTSLNCKGGWGM